MNKKLKKILYLGVGIIGLGLLIAIFFLEEDYSSFSEADFIGIAGLAILFLSAILSYKEL